MVLWYHDPHEWAEEVAARLAELGCSEDYVERERQRILETAVRNEPPRR